MQDDTSRKPIAPVGTNGADERHEEDEVSLIDLLLVVARYKRLIGGTVLAFFVVGFLVAVLSPDEYTSSAKVVREIQADASLGSVGALSALRGFGLSLGAGATGLTPEAYPDITKGREVGLAVVRDEFFFPDLDKSLTFVEYVRDNKSIVQQILALPGRLVALLKSDKPTRSIQTYDDTIIYLTEDEERAITAVSKLVSTSVDLESGLMTISAKTYDPNLSASLTASFVRHLVERVREILTVKTRKNLEFIDERFAEAEVELRAAEEALAQFMDRNTSIKSASLTTDRDRLQRQVTFKTQLYGDLQTQLTQAQIELQRSEPVITILERPAPPIEPSGVGGKVVLLIFLLLGAAIGVALAFIKWSLDQQMTDDEERAKMEEVRNALIPKRWVPLAVSRRFKRREPKTDKAAG
jgi:uncharacterized protein involved in exopolysaccharide biosynthesis